MPDPRTDTDWNKEDEMGEKPGVVVNLGTLAYGQDLQVIAAIRELLNSWSNLESVAEILRYVASDYGLMVVPKETPHE